MSNLLVPHWLRPPQFHLLSQWVTKCVAIKLQFWYDCLCHIVTQQASGEFGSNVRGVPGLISPDKQASDSPPVVIEARLWLIWQKNDFWFKCQELLRGSKPLGKVESQRCLVKMPNVVCSMNDAIRAMTQHKIRQWSAGAGLDSGKSVTVIIRL